VTVMIFERRSKKQKVAPRANANLSEIKYRYSFNITTSPIFDICFTR